MTCRSARLLVVQHHAASGQSAGYILLPVALALSLIASVAYLSNGDSGANIGMVASRSDGDRARYAAEAGLAHVAYLIQEKTCSGYPQAGNPTVPSEGLNGAFYSAHADRDSGSPVLLTSTGSYNGAKVMLTRPNVIVYQAGTLTFVIQPDPFDGKDASVSEKNVNTNYGADPQLRVKTGDFEALIQFDTSILPSGSRPVDRYPGGTAVSIVPGAQLSLYQTQGATGATLLRLHLMQVGWTEDKRPDGSPGGATWNTSNGLTAWPPLGQRYHSSPVAAEITTDPAGRKLWNVTDAATAWLSGSAPNHGLWIAASGASKNLEYVSSEELLDLGQRPSLGINYLLPCGAKAPQRSAPLPISRDSEIASTDPLGVALPPRDSADRIAVSFSASAEKRALLAFDIGAIPPGRSVASARLRLFLAESSPNSTSRTLTLTVHALIVQPWVEAASWTEPLRLSGTLGSVWGALPGGRFSATPAATKVLPQGFSEGNWVEFDVAPLVQDWIDGRTPNLGVIVRNTTLANDELRFASRDDLAGKRPELVVTYR